MTRIAVRFEMAGRDVDDIKVRARQLLDQLAGPFRLVEDLVVGQIRRADRGVWVGDVQAVIGHTDAEVSALGHREGSG